MPSKRMIPHVVTLYNRDGDNEDGSARYVVTVLKNVYRRGDFGVSSISNPADHAVVHVFDMQVSASPGEGVTLDRSLYPEEVAKATPVGRKPFLPENEWAACEHRELYWTLKGDGKDYVTAGDTSSIPASIIFANGLARRITTVKRNCAGSRLMWRWRVTAE